MKTFWIMLLSLGLFAASHSPVRAASLLTVDARVQAQAPETGYLHFGAASSPSGQAIGINSRYLTLNGKPWLPVMGEFHYSRFPNRYWAEELEKMKAAGIDIVSTYIFWNHHEEHEGHFLWTGDRDLRRFVTLAGSMGLKVMVRPGPWVHAESRFGGIPDWVVHAMPTRSNDPVYLRYTARYYGEVAKQLKGLLWKDGGPVIGMQLENEYNLTGPGQGREHIAALKRIALQAGFDLPLYTVTGWDNTLYPSGEVTPVQGGYADQPWGVTADRMPPAETYAFRFGSRTKGNLGAETMGAAHGDADPDIVHTPFLGAEFGGGVPTMYRRRPRMTGDDVAAMLPVELGSGANLYGYYMFHGGQISPDHNSLEENTAIGAYNDLPMIDYDFQAPLGAYGQQHASMGKLRPIHYFLQAFGGDLAPMTVHAPDIVSKDATDLDTPRFSVRSLDDSGFLFVNNYVRQYPMAVQKDVQFRVALPGGVMTFPARPIDIPSGAYFIWPINMNLGGARLAYATVQPVTRIEDAGGPVFVFRAVDGIAAELAFDGADEVTAPSGMVSRDGARIVLRDLRPGGDALIAVRTGKSVTRLLILSAAESERLSLLPLQGRTRLVLTDAQLYAGKQGPVLLSTGEPRFRFSVFPALAKPLVADLPVEAAGHDGVFQNFTAEAPPRRIAVRFSKLHDAGPVPPLAMTGPKGTAVEPAPEVFGKSAAWSIAVPRDATSGLADAFLRIRARGDVGRLFAGTWLMDDHFLDGSIWEIELKRFTNEIGAPLTLTVLPMRDDAAIYLDAGMAAMATGDQTAELLDVTAVPQYRLELHAGEAKPAH